MNKVARGLTSKTIYYAFESDWFCMKDEELYILVDAHWHNINDILHDDIPEKDKLE